MTEQPSRTVLRRFYGRMFGRKVPDEELFDDVPFEVYYQLRRILYPRVTKKTAARNSPLAKYNELADSLPDEAPSEKSGRRLRWITVRGKTIDLRSEEIAADVESLDVHRVKEVRGWPTLVRLSELKELSATSCKTPSEEGFESPILLERLEVDECDTTTLSTLLTGTRCKSVRLIHMTDPILDLRPLAEHDALIEVRVGAPLIRNVDALCGRALERLSLGDVAVDDALRRCLASAAPSLEFLQLRTSTDFTPDQMPTKLPRLERCRMTVHVAQEDAWLDYAADHPHIAFQFTRDAKVDRGKLTTEIEDYHREIEILKITKGKKVHYEVSGDLATTFGFDDNAELEDAARPLVKAAKRRIKWSSEHDTFVATAKKPDDLRWLIDALLDD